MLTNFHTKYKVECKIGEGSFSEVLKCVERTTGKLVAAKQLKKHFKSINHASDIPELMVLKKISKHPNLLELYESYFDSSTAKVTLVFELMDMSLFDFMKTRKRPILESRAKKYLFQIIKGVDHLHYHGIFHRDIKPENVLIKGDRIKISDMGSIKGFYSKQPYTEYISTRWYRSPECLLTKGFYGPKMDIWAIGCVYYELLTLKPLFPGSDELDQIVKINNVLGSPSAKLMNKLKKVKCRNLVPSFPHKKGTGLNSVIPMMSDEGREIFKHMIVYDPDSRINVRRLLEHKYFNDLRHEEMLSQKLLSSQNASPTKLMTSPMWLSFITASKKRRIKRKISAKQSIEKKHSFQTATHSNVNRIETVISSNVSFSNNSDEVDESTSRVYAMKPIDREEYMKTNVIPIATKPPIKFYHSQSNKIPGYEQFARRKLLQDLSSKALVGLSLMKSKVNKGGSYYSSNPTNLKSGKSYEGIKNRHKNVRTISREMGQESLHTRKGRRDQRNHNPLIGSNCTTQMQHNDFSHRHFPERLVSAHPGWKDIYKSTSLPPDQCFVTERSCPAIPNTQNPRINRLNVHSNYFPINVKPTSTYTYSVADQVQKASPQMYLQDNFISHFSENHKT